LLLTESAGCVVSNSEQCCYRTFDLTNKTCLLPKLAPKLQLSKLVQLATPTKKHCQHLMLPWIII